MDRRRRLAAAVALTLVVGLTACGAAPRGRVVGRGTLGYAVALADDALYTIELELRFALVVRDRAGVVRVRIDLGPSERDVLALAVVGDLVAIGGADQRVRLIRPADGAVLATWPHGATVTALAAVDGRWLVIGDREGAVCVRRLLDGALLHCVALDGPVGAVVAEGRSAVVEVGADTFALALPRLSLAPAAPPAIRVRGPEVVVDGRVVARFAAPARAVARDRHGWAAVGWIRALGDASVIIGGAGTPTRH